MREVKIKSASNAELEFVFGGGDGDLESREDQLIIIMFGEDFSGKSRFIGTCPELTAVLPLDRKTKHSAEKTAREMERRILMPKQDLVREAECARIGFQSAEASEKEIEAEKEKTKKKYRSRVNMIKDVAWTMHAHRDVQAVAIDLFDMFYQDVLFAHYGRTGHMIRKISASQMYKDTKEADQELQDFVESLTSKHLLMNCRRKENYENNVQRGFTWSGYKWLGHKANLVTEMVINKRYVADSDEEDRQWRFGLNVVKSLHRPDLQGEMGKLKLIDGEIGFDQLRQVILHGEVNGETSGAAEPDWD